MSMQNEPAIGTITVAILDKYGALPRIMQVAGAYEICVNHQRTGCSFKKRSMSLAILLQEYYGWRVAQDALLAQVPAQTFKAGGQHATA